MTENTDINVAIVGLGPVGATLANLLGQAGISTCVFEREPHPYPLPRAVHFDDEVMRVFQTIGITETLADKLRINPGMRFVNKDHELLLDWPRPDTISPQGWHSSYRFHQPELEQLLRDALTQSGCVDIYLNTEVLDIEQHPNGCAIQYRDLASDPTTVKQINANYVVGCDGANSRVREAMDTSYIDFGFEERWLVVDVILKKEKPELGDHTIQYCNPARPHTYARGPGGRRRWEFRINDRDDSQKLLDEDTIWGLLSDWLTPAEATLERKAIYTFKSAIAEQWRHGRMLVAGDAAHLTPPFMGQGMCGGIRDASNLAWKLDACLKFGHTDSLLDSYQQERSPHMETYIKTAMTLGKLISTSGTEEALKSSLINADGSSRMKSINRALGIGLVAGDQTHCGALFPQLTTHTGERIDRHVGYAPMLIVSPDMASDTATLQSSWPDLRILSSKDLPAANAVLERYQTQAVLIRADRYILGTARSLTDLKQLLEFHPTGR